MDLRAVMIGASLLVGGWACQTADFKSGGGRRGASPLTPGNTRTKPIASALDVSKLEENRTQAANGGPAVGDGAIAVRTIELTCEQSSGAVIEVIPTAGGNLRDQSKALNLADGGILIGSNNAPITFPSNPFGGLATLPGQAAAAQLSLPVGPTVATPANSQVQVQVKGQFCPTAQNSLTVLFLVDFSGSMGAHNASRQGDPRPGNDPQVDGSCGRMRGAQAVLEKIKATRKPNEQVQIGMVPFAGGIVNDKIIQMVDADTFAGLINKDSFCSHIVQESSSSAEPNAPGAIRSAGVDASTNYSAAFLAAQSLLANAYGRKEVFFLTDGEPTSGGWDPVLAGITSGTALRATVTNLTLNALILGDASPAAEQVLVGVAGSADRVRRVANTQELVEQIMNFPDAGIDEATGSAVLSVVPYQPNAALGLRSLQKLTSPVPVWAYETQPFMLLGRPGEVVDHTVMINAKGRDGSTHQATIVLRYRQ